MPEAVRRRQGIIGRRRLRHPEPDGPTSPARHLPDGGTEEGVGHRRFPCRPRVNQKLKRVLPVGVVPGHLGVPHRRRRIHPRSHDPHRPSTGLRAVAGLPRVPGQHHPLVLAERGVPHVGLNARGQDIDGIPEGGGGFAHDAELEGHHRQHATGSLPVVARPRTPAGRARRTAERLAEVFPGSAHELCALDHADPFQLLAATILSAQCTDQRVNLTTPALFARYPDAYALAAADPAEVEEIIHSTGFFRAKARNLIGMARVVVERFGGEIPSAMSDLVILPGVGRKTANVVRSVAFDLPGLPVDTHVQRLSARLGLTAETDPVRVETALNAMIPASQRGVFSLRLILHGRATCTARSPHCEQCVLADFCPSVRSPSVTGNGPALAPGDTLPGSEPGVLRTSIAI